MYSYFFYWDLGNKKTASIILTIKMIRSDTLYHFCILVALIGSSGSLPILKSTMVKVKEVLLLYKGSMLHYLGM